MDVDLLRTATSGVDVVLHFAGVNRPTDKASLADNMRIARLLTDALDNAGSRPNIVYANSVQADSGTEFGQIKQAAAEHLVAWGRRTGAHIADVHLPNLFGEHGKPFYNSVVATFSYQLAHGSQPVIIEDRLLPLLHVQDAAEMLIDLADRGVDGRFSPEGFLIDVSTILMKLQEYHRLYINGEIPNVDSGFDRALFNTYRSFCFPDLYPIYIEGRSDQRGSLYECIRAHGGRTQVFYSTTRPGASRGNHFHRRKIERFVVIQGVATIALRRLFDQTITRFEVRGDRPAIVDMPTMWTHSISNSGPGELLTMFWADELADPIHSDTYPESVDLRPQTA